MDDVSTTVGQHVHGPRPAHVPASEGGDLLDACRVALVDGSAPESGQMLVASGAAPHERAVQARRSVARVYCAVSWAHHYAVAVLARGVVEALEQPELADAPVGALLLTDSDDGREGVICAERVLGGGWMLREGAL